ncbi:hypothetical protein LX32DRAFT_654450 [Colletotrichum zoysiae]|uniref:Uncharacterized protein n=1 Tax=Colletotrichum zoysiae TaxID=1216348 RepID=A0AAD9HD96_9PEZI|nr:hypothetical protein LX32DRAFT_654450 [Colletotrichum zoysiae]
MEALKNRRLSVIEILLYIFILASCCLFISIVRIDSAMDPCWHAAGVCGEQGLPSRALVTSRRDGTVQKNLWRAKDLAWSGAYASTTNVVKTSPSFIKPRAMHLDFELTNLGRPMQQNRCKATAAPVGVREELRSPDFRINHVDGFARNSGHEISIANPLGIHMATSDN